MKKLTDKLVPALALLFAAVLTICVLTAATPSNIPISGMNITTQAVEGAYFPLIQPWPGRPTNDNWRIAKSNLFYGIGTITVTNLYATNLYVTNIYASITNIYFTNLFVTNLYVSNIISSDLLWTNDASFGGNGRVTIKPEITYEYLYPSNTIFAGWVSYVPQFKLMAAGSNNIPCNMYSSFLIVGADPDPSVSKLYLQSGAVFGQDLLLFSYTNTPFNGKFTLPADSAVVGGIGNVKLANGQDWIGENGAVMRLFWADPDWWEVGRWYAGGTNQPTTVTMNPTDGYLPVRSGPDTFGDSPWYTNSTDVLTDGRIGFGPGLTNWLYRDYSGMDLIYTNQNATQVRFGVASDTGLIYMTALSGYGGEIATSGGLNLSNGSDLLTLYGGQLYPSVDNSVSLGIDIRAWKDMSIAGPIYFTPGTTNQLYRSGNSLVITNGSTTNFLKIVNGSANELQLGFTTSGQPLLTSSTGFLFTDSAVFLPGSAQPNGTASLGLGNSSSGYWDGVYSQDEIVINGFNPGGSGGNYSQVNMKHTGAGGEIAFTSQAAGTGGSPVPFNFKNANLAVNSLPFFNGSGSFQANINTTTAYMTNITVAALTAGDNTIFTTPTGYKAIPMSGYFAKTNTGTTFYSVKYRTNGVNYLTGGTPATSGTSTRGQVAMVDNLMRYDDDSFVFGVNQNEGPAVVSFLVVTNTIPINTYGLLSLSAGDNTLYTVPTNTIATVYIGTQGMSLRYGNASGGPRNIQWYYVPVGQTTTTFPFLVATNTVSDGNSQSVGLMGAAYPPFIMKEGDSIVINTDANTATQSAFVTVLELPE